MRGLFPKLVVILMALALSGCVALAPAKGKPTAGNPVTGEEIEVTSLDPPTPKDGEAAKESALRPTAGDAKPAEAAADGDALPPPPADAPTTKPKPRPETAAEAVAGNTPEAVETAPTPEAADTQAEAAKSPSQLACEKKGNIWAKVGESGAHYCAKRTRDNGKRCTKATDCEGVCLARSGTCAPFDPLFGCNEILQNDGSRVTQCIN